MLFCLVRQFSNQDKNIVMTSLQLYKHLLRQCETLPPDACKYYKFAVKQVNYFYNKNPKLPHLFVTNVYSFTL